VIDKVTERIKANAWRVSRRLFIAAGKEVWRVMSLWKLFGLTFVMLLTAVPLAAATNLKGWAFNETTRTPAAGDPVILLSLSEGGMSETARTQTDDKGRFALPVADPQVTHVVRVVHQGVTYHQIVEPGSRPIAVVVYDVANRVDGVTAVMDVERFEASNDALEVKQLVTMRNDSRPPRTLMNGRPFEIRLPPDAVVESGLVQVEEGQPLKQKPIAGDQKGLYYFSFPLRPGDTRFAVVYRLHYSGAATIEPQLRSPMEKFVVMLPKSMKFDPAFSGIFHAMPNTTPDNVQGTDAMTSENTLGFRISGTGMLEELKGRRQEAKNTKAASAASQNSPGGGLGPPIEAPDPLQKYRWPILVGFGITAVAGATYVTRKASVSRTAYLAALRKVQQETAEQRNHKRAKRSNRQRVHV
jgi:hypothetical protein